MLLESVSRPLSGDIKLYWVNIMFKQIVSLFFLSLIGFSVSAEVFVEDGYIRKPLPGRYMSAAFLTLKNNGDQDVVFASASLQGAGLVEFHTHTHVDGVMRMREIPELVVPAKGETILEPGGKHLMVFKIGQLPKNPMLSLCDANDVCVDTKLEARDLVKR